MGPIEILIAVIVGIVCLAVGALVGNQAPGETGTRQVAAGMLCSLLEGIGLLWN